MCLLLSFFSPKSQFSSFEPTYLAEVNHRVAELDRMVVLEEQSLAIGSVVGWFLLRLLELQSEVLDLTKEGHG